MESDMLSRAADYAVRAVIYLAGLEQGARVAQQDIAAAIDAPYTFAGKILQRLVASEIVESRRGKGGGFSLTSKGRSGSMFDVLVAVDGHPALNDCLSAATKCPRAPFCAAHRVWNVAQTQVLNVLKSARIDALAAETARLAGCGPAPIPGADAHHVNWVHDHA
jgi:Rrf2 family protein